MGAAGICSVFLLAQWWRGRTSLIVIVTGLAMVTVGWIVAKLHLWLFDRLYRGAGAVRRRDTDAASARPVPPVPAV